MRSLAVALLGAVFLNLAFLPSRPVLPGLSVLRLDQESALRVAGFLSLGMRRAAADVELIRLLVYYGTPEEGRHGHEWGGGEYPELGLRARRALDLDPSLRYAALVGAGALAFNLQRPDEALALLSHALSRDPGYWQYRAYAGAIAFHRKGDVESAIRLLEPALDEPDCPTLIKSMTAFLYRRTGQREKAVRLYRLIHSTSRDPGYRGQAERALRALGAL